MEDEQSRPDPSGKSKRLVGAKASQIAALLPDATPAVASKVLEQFPAFSKFGSKAIRAIETAHERTIEAGHDSQERLNAELDDIRARLQSELEREGVSEEHRRFVIEQLMAVGRERSENHRAQFAFLKQVHARSVLSVAATVVAGAAVVAVQILVNSRTDKA